MYYCTHLTKHPFLERSDDSMRAAEILHKQRCHPSTINRAYYAYLQCLLHTIFEKLNYDPNKLYNDSQWKGDGGTHVQASNLICRLLEKELTPREYKWYQKTIKELKKQRTTADYFSEEITIDESQIALRSATDLITCVKQNVKQ